MTSALLKDKKGVVLVMVLAVVALFTAMVIEFLSNQVSDLEMAYNFKDSVQAYYLSRSGLEAAKVLIEQDDATYDAPDEPWAMFSEYAMASSTILEGPSFAGELTDECSRLDLNSLVDTGGVDAMRKEQFKALFRALNIKINDDELSSISDALADWIDTDDNPTGLGGAEYEYYEGLADPYECKNGPMDTPEEILLIKGFKKEFFYGTEEYTGIKDFVTVGTKGKINVNTASEEVLLALAAEKEDLVALIMDKRPFKSETDLQNIVLNKLEKDYGFDDASVTKLKNIMTIKSSSFLVKVRGVMPSGAILDLKAVLAREGSNVQTLYYRIE